jgi:hypothetical protein
VEPELGQVFKIAERSGNTLIAKLRVAWDSPAVLCNKAKLLPANASLPHISLIGHITAEEFKIFDLNLITNGLINRFIFVHASRARSIPNPRRIVWPGALIEEAKEIYRLAHLPTQIDCSLLGEIHENTFQDNNLDEESEKIWEKIYLEPNQGNATLEAVLERYHAHIRKLALIYAVFDRSRAITPTHLLAAKAIADHSKACALSIYGTLSSNKAANKILTALKRRFPSPLSRDEIYNDVFNRNVPKADIEEALCYLTQNNLARMEFHKALPPARKPTEFWFAIP